MPPPILDIGLSQAVAQGSHIGMGLVDLYDQRRRSAINQQLAAEKLAYDQAQFDQSAALRARGLDLTEEGLNLHQDQFDQNAALRSRGLDLTEGGLNLRRDQWDAQQHDAGVLSGMLGPEAGAFDGPDEGLGLYDEAQSPEVGSLYGGFGPQPAAGGVGGGPDQATLRTPQAALAMLKEHLGKRTVDTEAKRTAEFINRLFDTPMRDDIRAGAVQKALGKVRGEAAPAVLSMLSPEAAAAMGMPAPTRDHVNPYHGFTVQAVADNLMRRYGGQMSPKQAQAAAESMVQWGDKPDLPQIGYNRPEQANENERRRMELATRQADRKVRALQAQWAKARPSERERIQSQIDVASAELDAADHAYDTFLAQPAGIGGGPAMPQTAAAGAGGGGQVTPADQWFDAFGSVMGRDPTEAEFNEWKARGAGGGQR